MEFNCQQCGKCCRGLLLKDNGLLRGLTLLLEEIHLFSLNQMKPYLGFGKRPYSKGFKIMMYQLTEANCPHLMNNQCTIYLNRPVTCRQFPFSLDPDKEDEILLGVDMNCPAAVELVNNSGGAIDFPDRESAMKKYVLKRLVVENPRKSWIYDLDSGKWVRYDKLA